MFWKIVLRGLCTKYLANVIIQVKYLRSCVGLGNVSVLSDKKQRKFIDCLLGLNDAQNTHLILVHVFTLLSVAIVTLPRKQDK